MVHTELGETIYTPKDITTRVLDSIMLSLWDGGYSRFRNTCLNEFMTMDIETSTVGRSTDEPVAFTYSIAVYITGKCLLFRTWEDYIDFIKTLADLCQLGKGNRLVCYVHNLPYEFQFMRNFMQIEEVFATDKRKVVKCYSDGIEYRCSYKLTNMGLERFTNSIPDVKHKKLSGKDFDYSIVRTPETTLTPSELDYIYNDVAGLHEALTYTIEHDKYNIANIPLTSTGYVRREMREAMAINPENRENFLDSKLDAFTYGLLREARRGGNTHCNPIYSCQELPDMESQDMSSAYPAVMIQKKFPMTKFFPIRRTSDFEEYVNNGYACIIDITFNTLAVKNLDTIPYIPKAHCTQLRNIIGDNGRVLEAEKCSMVITDIDYKIIRDTYDWLSCEVRYCYVAEYGYLPDELRNELRKQYYNKTTLKDKDPYYYMKAKNKFNANFGMMLTDICRDNIIYNEDSTEPFTVEKADYEQALRTYYKTRNNFLQYQHGVWVTAWCRYRLQQAINGLSRDMVYCDTDSVKFLFPEEHRGLFDRLNREIRQDISDCGIDCTVEYKGKTYTLGLWEYDGHYKRFKSMGAKKYCFYDDNNNFSITVAGLSKSKARDYLAEHGGIDAFKAGTIIPVQYSGRTSARYNDYDSLQRIWVKGEPITVGSNLVITDTTYQFTLSEDYENLILQIEQGAIF